MGAITYVDENGSFKTYKFSMLQEHGVTLELHQRLKYANEVVDHIYKKQRY